MKSHFAQKRDENEKAIMDFLRAVGYRVKQRWLPNPEDLEVTKDEKSFVIVEVKMPGKGFTPRQKVYYLKYPHRLEFVVTDGQEALAVVARYI